MKQIRKKAMSNFEIIGYAILAIIVIIVAITIFTKLSKNPSSTLGKIGENTKTNTDSCISNPSSCDPFKTTASNIEPSKLQEVIKTNLFKNKGM